MLGATNGPWLVTFDGSSSDADEFAWRCAADGYTARLLRGERMQTEPALFAELGAALQFPYYFGGNWPALAECLADLDWLDAGKGYVIVITNPELVLAHEKPTQLAVLSRLFGEAAATWAEAVDDGQPWDRPAVPFHVVLQTTPDEPTTRWPLDPGTATVS